MKQFHKVYSVASFDALKVFLRLRTKYDHCFILESVDTESDGAKESTSKWTFFGWDPLLEINLNDGVMLVKNLQDGSINVQENCTDPNLVLREICDRYQTAYNSEMPPFSGGLMGYFAYDYIKYAEPTLRQKMERMKNTEQWGDLDLMLFDKVVAFDHTKNQLWIIVNVDENTSDIGVGDEKCTDLMKNVYNLIQSGEYVQQNALQLHGDAAYLFDEQQFAKVAETAKRHIDDGDIFQVVLSNRVEFEASGSLFDVYAYLRKHNPSPYMYYISSNTLEIAGASPETLVSAKYSSSLHSQFCDTVTKDAANYGTQNLVAHTYPLAGTRPRGKNITEDLEFERELLSDKKELAEHNMLVDLGRNDLGKVSEFATVEVKEYMKVLKFSHVMHIGSKVRGILREDKDALDLIAASLPAGTLSGAPKIRACEIIDELEGDSRGIYGGALGYISLDGQMDMCITIRSAYKKGGKVYARSGAGIVMDSDPSAEYAETRNKLASVMEALCAKS